MRQWYKVTYVILEHRSESQVQKVSSGIDQVDREKAKTLNGTSLYFMLRNNRVHLQDEKNVYCIFSIHVIGHTWYNELINNNFTIRFIFPPHWTLWSSTQNRVFWAPCKGLVEEWNHVAVTSVCGVDLAVPCGRPEGAFFSWGCTWTRPGTPRSGRGGILQLHFSTTRWYACISKVKIQPCSLSSSVASDEWTR